MKQSVNYGLKLKLIKRQADSHVALRRSSERRPLFKNFNQ